MDKPYKFRHFVMRADMRAALDAYAREHHPIGDFLTAVLENDLMGAMGRADEDNLLNMPAICAYVYNEMPSRCHGSVEQVDAWLAERTQP